MTKPRSSSSRPRHAPVEDSAALFEAEAVRRTALWAGVGLTMALIVTGWAWSFRASIKLASAPTEPQPFTVVAEELGELIGTTPTVSISEAVERLNVPSFETATAPDAETVAALKAKVLSAAAAEAADEE